MSKPISLRIKEALKRIMRRTPALVLQKNRGRIAPQINNLEKLQPLLNKKCYPKRRL